MYEFAVTVFAEYLIFMLPLASFIVWVRLSRSNRLLMTWRALLAGLIGLGIAAVAREMFYNPRPFTTGQVDAFFFQEANNGFPSTHTLTSSLVAVVTYMSSRRIGLLLGLCALAIGIARVLGHVHSWVDILASIVIALVALMLTNWIIPRLPAGWATLRRSS